MLCANKPQAAFENRQRPPAILGISVRNNQNSCAENIGAVNYPLCNMSSNLDRQRIWHATQLGAQVFSPMASPANFQSYSGKRTGLAAGHTAIARLRWIRSQVLQR